MLELRKTLGLHLWASLGAALLLLVLGASPVLADGTETLDEPSVPIAAGSGIVSGGVGLADGQPGDITVVVPLGATVKQVLLYWEGANRLTGDATAEMQITVNGDDVTGRIIGGDTLYANEWRTVSYRADITALGLIGPGSNTISVGGLDYTRENDGAGVLVIYDDGARAVIEVRDGNDYAHIRNAGTLMVTVPQTFTFAAASVDRIARLDLLVGSVADDTGFLGFRPSSIEVEVGGTVTRFSDLLNSQSGRLIDSLYIEVDVPAGETSLTVELISRNDSGDWDCTTGVLGLCPASMVWVTAGLSIDQEEEVPPKGCRFTGGLNDTFETADGVNSYRSGGQAGANTALPPQPKGEWTHTQRRGPAGRFTFHGGTASAPEGTEIDEIRCSDPFTCTPSGDPPSPLKQLDFDGIGTFRSIGMRDGQVPDFVLAGATVTAQGRGNVDFDGTFHWFEVNIDDLGEPGNTNRRKNPDDADPELCPPNGFGEKGDHDLANCGCSDFYRITIYDGVYAADVVKNPDGSIDPSMLNRVDVIYEVQGYIDGGNLQIHRLTGFDR